MTGWCICLIKFNSVEYTWIFTSIKLGVVFKVLYEDFEWFLSILIDIILESVLASGLRKISTLWVASLTMVLWRVITWWSKDAVLDLRRGWLHFASLWLTRHPVWLWRKSNSSSLTPPQNLGTDVSRQHRKNRNSMVGSRRKCANWSGILGYHMFRFCYSISLVYLILYSFLKCNSWIYFVSSICVECLNCWGFGTVFA